MQHRSLHSITSKLIHRTLAWVMLSVLGFGAVQAWRTYHAIPLVELVLDWDKRWSDLPEAAYVAFRRRLRRGGTKYGYQVHSLYWLIVSIHPALFVQRRKKR